MTNTTASAKCPGTVCTCGGTELVTVKSGTSRGRATRVYSPCASLIAQGWTGRVASVEWA